MSKSFLQPSRSCALSFGVWICRWLLRSDDLFFPASLQWQFQEFASDSNHFLDWVPLVAPLAISADIFVSIGSTLASFNSAIAHQLVGSAGLVLGWCGSGGVRREFTFKARKYCGYMSLVEMHAVAPWPLGQRRAQSTPSCSSADVESA